MKIIQVIKVGKSDKDKAKEAEKRMNNKMAPLVNIVYALAMCVETLAADKNQKTLIEVAGRLRAKVHQANESISEDFGDWAEHVEELLNDVLEYHEEHLPILCFLSHKYARKMEDYYRSFDPRFDFYQRDEINALKRYADRYELPAYLLHKADVVIINAMRA